MNTLPFRRLGKYALLCAPLAIVACDDDDVLPIVNDSPSDVLEARDEFEELEELLDATDLLDVLDAQAQLTLFAPNNAAVAAAGPAISAMTPEMQRTTLLYHAVGGATLRAADIPEGLTIFRSADDSTPSFIVSNDDDGIVVNDANVVEADIETDNGIIHEIDAVLTLPDVVDLATYADLSELANALTRADLITTLQGDGPFTVFAPSNEAFDANEEDLTDERLAEILTYHVVPGVILVGDITDGQTVQTVAGGELTFRVAADGTVNISDLNDDTPDFTVSDIANVRATNGVIHVIDGVLFDS